MDKVFSIKPDLIVCHPQHLDYPLFRQQIRDNRDRFKKVIVVFTNHNVGRDYRSFVREAMKQDDIDFIDNRAVGGEQDWRNIATNLALSKSNSKWVFFTEQDFFWEDGFWDQVYLNSKSVNYMSVLVQGRVHPCCIIITRSAINKTSKDFSVTKDVSDHFGKIQRDLEGKPCFSIPANLWLHLGGLSQNMHILMNGGTVEYMPEAFMEYVNKCLYVSVPMHEDFINLFKSYQEQ